MRINAYLARAGVASRRKAGELIKAGRVQINGKVAELNASVSDSDVITVDGKPIEAQTLRYVLLNKPAGTLTTLADPQGRKTVVQLIEIPQRIVPVGRLDYDTTGALLLTNDGELAHKLMHPKFQVDKVYVAAVDGEITQQKLNELSRGVRLEDGITAPAGVRKMADSTLEITIHEGRKRQVKRMLSAVGLQVKSLHRSRYASLDLSGLKPGHWRDLTQAEINNLKDL